jgi:arginase
MNGEILEILVVPWDVERQDTPNARGPRGLLTNGFPDLLRKAGREVRVTEVEAPEDAKLGTVIAIGRRIAEAVALAVSRGRFPLILTGGCLASLGAVTGLQRDGREAAVVWIDAHGDLNTPESSPSGYWDGMSLAALAGLSLPEVAEGIGLRPLAAGRLAHLAGRSFDPQVEAHFERLGLLRIPAGQVATAASRERLRSLSDGCSLYLHVDVDGLDPRDAPAVGFPEPDGARLADLLALRDDLPAPAAMTLSALSFDRVDEAEARRTAEACARLVETFVAGSSRQMP